MSETTRTTDNAQAPDDRQPEERASNPGLSPSMAERPEPAPPRPLIEARSAAERTGDRSRVLEYMRVRRCGAD